MSIVKSGQIFPMIVDIDNTHSLEELARLAVNENNLGNICSKIPFARLKCAECGNRVLYPGLVPFLPWEIPEKAAQRLTAEGYILGSSWALAQFTAQYFEEVEKYSSVFSLAEGSRWLDVSTRWRNYDPDRYVPYTKVDGKRRCFRRFRFDRPLGLKDRIIVF